MSDFNLDEDPVDSAPVNTESRHFNLDEDPPSQAEEISQPGAFAHGGLGYPLSPIEAKKLAAQHLVNSERARGVNDLATTEELQASGQVGNPTWLGKGLASMTGQPTDLPAGGINQIGAGQMSQVSAAMIPSVLGGPAIVRGIEKATGVDPTLVQALGTGTIDQNPLTSFSGSTAGSLIGPAGAAKGIKGAMALGAAQGAINSASDQYSRDQDVSLKDALVSGGLGAAIGGAGYGAVKAVPLLADRASKLAKDIHESIKIASQGKPIIASHDITEPIILAHKSTKDNPIHYGDVSDAIDDSTKFLISKIAPAEGIGSRRVESRRKIDTAFAKMFKADPDSMRDPVSGLAATVEKAQEIYPEYLAIGESRPDVMVNVSPVHKASEAEILNVKHPETGESVGLSDPEVVKAYQVPNEIKSVPEVPLPTAISMLQQMNKRIAQLRTNRVASHELDALMLRSGEMRKVIDPVLEKIGGQRAVALRTTYGELSELSKALSPTVRKMEKNMVPGTVGSIHDLVGAGELVSAGIHAVHAGINPLGAAVAIHGAMSLSKGAEKRFYQDANKMMLKAHERLSKRIQFQDSIKIPDNWKAPATPYVQPPKMPSFQERMDAQARAATGGGGIKSPLQEIPLTAETLSQMGGRTTTPRLSENPVNMENLGGDVGYGITGREGMSPSQIEQARTMRNSIHSQQIRPPIISEANPAFEHIGKTSRDIPRPEERSFTKEFFNQPDFKTHMAKLEKAKAEATSKAEKSKLEDRLKREQTAYEKRMAEARKRAVGTSSNYY